jgi:hypothetical protein
LARAECGLLNAVDVDLECQVHVDFSCAIALDRPFINRRVGHFDQQIARRINWVKAARHCLPPAAVQHILDMNPAQ